MKYAFKVTIECSDDQFEGYLPSREKVADFLMHEMLLSGGNYFSGNEEMHPDWEFILYRYGITNVK